MILNGHLINEFDAGEGPTDDRENYWKANAVVLHTGEPVKTIILDTNTMYRIFNNKLQTSH